MASPEENRERPAIAIIAPAAALRLPKRFARMAPILIRAGYNVRYIGWERRKGEAHELAWGSPHVTEEHILRGGGHGSRHARAMYPLWMLSVFWKALRLGKGPIACLGWETAFPARVAAIFTGAPILFDDGDRFSMLLKLPKPLHLLLQALEHWTSRASFLHIVPGLSRYEWHGDNMMVLRNAPTASDLEAARRSAPPRPSARLVLYANGWLGETRGAPILLEAMERLTRSDTDVVMITAGRVDSENGRKLLAHPRVEHRGEVSAEEALALYHSSDLALTLYDPSIEINRHAESNKWGDCVHVGTPFIVNSEVETARPFVESGAAWAVPYHDVDELVALLTRLAKEPNLLAEKFDIIKQIKIDFPNFDDQFDVILKRIVRT